MEYQIESLKKYRNRKVFSIGFIVTSEVIIWTGVWFKYINISEELIRVRYEDFDDGWSYKFHWTNWEEKWTFIKVEK